MTPPATSDSNDIAEAPPSNLTEALARRHLRLGWWALLVFLSLGAVLEALHGFKVDAYLNVDNEARRLMWRLAHAHGTLIALVQIAFALTLRSGDFVSARSLRVASAGYVVALLLLPGGFFLGGLELHGGDPGPAILLVPPGALALFVAVGLTAWGVERRHELGRGRGSADSSGVPRPSSR